MGTEKSSNNHWGADVTAGLTAGIANIPDVMPRPSWPEPKFTDLELN
jgi:MFS superfamily sulfate permease-like transporter